MLGTPIPKAPEMPEMPEEESVQEQTSIQVAAADPQVSKPASSRAIIGQAALIWLASRIMYCILTYFAVLLTLGRRTGASFAPDRLVALWEKSDVTWYLRLSAGGYATDSYRAAFFPLYPGLTEVVTVLIGGNPHRLAAAMIVSNLGTLAACIGLALLAAHEFGNSTAPTAVRVMLAYPLALFLFAGYADSLLVAFCVFALYFARRGSWRWAAVCGFLAGLTRPTSVILVLPLLWEYGRQQGIWQLLWHKQWQALFVRLRPATLGNWLLVVICVPAAIGLYALYLWRTFGDPLLFVHLQASAWHRHLLSPWHLLALAVTSWQSVPTWGFAHAYMLVDEAPVVIFIILTYFVARRLPVMYTIFMLGVLFTAVSSPIVDYTFHFAAAGRYLLPSIPIFLLLGHWVRKHPWLDQLIIGGGIALQAVLVVYFLTSGPLI
jgi:hypothetical protein